MLAFRMVLLLLLSCDPRLAVSQQTVDTSRRAAPDWGDEVPQLVPVPAPTTGTLQRADRALLACRMTWPPGDFDVAPAAPPFLARGAAADPVLELDFGISGPVSIDGGWNTTVVQGTVPAVSLTAGKQIDWEVVDWDLMSFDDPVARGSVTFKGDRAIAGTGNGGSGSCWLVDGADLQALATPREQTLRTALTALGQARADAEQQGFVPEEAILTARRAAEAVAAVRGWDDPALQQDLALLAARESQLAAEGAMIAATAVQSASPMQTPVKLAQSALEVQALTCGERAVQRIRAIPDTQPADPDSCVLDVQLVNTGTVPLEVPPWAFPELLRVSVVHASGEVQVVRRLTGAHTVAPGQAVALVWAFTGPPTTSALELRHPGGTVYLRLD